MKKTVKTMSAVLLLAIVLTLTISCAGQTDKGDIWENADYISDAIVGDGRNTVKLEIAAENRSVILNIKTDKSTLGEALYEMGLINDPSFFDTCNGIKADWSRDKAYWAFYADGAYASFGIGDSDAVTTGEVEYKLVYTKDGV